jgi:flavodoxin
MSKTLVAYFSASGVTEKVAKNLAESIGADLFEIVPEKRYTDADLDWTDKNSRSTVEMHDLAFRPPIASKVGDMAQYDTVFIGYPIWWYREPTIIDTFAESYDFSGKTIVPFATSGGSDMCDSHSNIAKLAKGADVLPGKRFRASADKKELSDWANGLMG